MPSGATYSKSPAPPPAQVIAELIELSKEIVAESKRPGWRFVSHLLGILKAIWLAF